MTKIGDENPVNRTSKNQPCTKEPQLGNVTWQYDVVQKNYMCTVCGERESVTEKAGCGEPVRISQATGEQLVCGRDTIDGKTFYCNDCFKEEAK